MRQVFRSILAAVAFTAAGSHAQVSVENSAHGRAQAALARNNTLDADPGTILVRFDPRLSAQGRGVARAAVASRAVEQYHLVPGLELIEVSVPAAQAIARYRATPGVLYAEPNYVVHASTTPNDPNFGLLWGMNNTGQTVNGATGTANADINAPEAWTTFTGDPNFVIANIDSGVNMNHPDIAANIWTNPGEIAGNAIDDDGNGYIDDINGWNFVSGNNNPTDDNGHGTHTAGSTGAVGNNGVGVSGVAWQCKLVPLKFLNSAGSGYTSDAMLAIQYCTGKGIKVSNNSWGGGGFSQAMFDAINASKAVGHVFVAAAGNSGANIDASPSYPASYNLDNIISVAATDSRDLRASFSNYGATTVDIGAPGVNILSTYGSGYAYLNGTSMAAPHVTGVVALVYGRNPSWTYSQVRTQILSTARPVSSLANITVTGGVVNALAAVGGGGGGGGNTAPSVSISSPASGAGFATGSSITFTGSSTDVQDGNLSAGMVWTSSLQGQIGTGGTFARSDLVVGTHTVTASSTDTGALSGSASVTVTVTSGGTIPNAPSNTVGSSPAAGRASVSWTDNSSNEISFEIQRQTRVGSTWTNTVTAGSVGTNVSSFTETVSAGRYRYRVRATNAAGSSAWSGWTGSIRVN